MNETDSRRAAQSRCHYRSSRCGRWIVAIPGFAILIAIMAVVSTPTAREAPQAPPPLQTFQHSKSTSNVPAVVRPQPKSAESLIRVNVTPGGVDSFKLEIRGGF